MAFLGLFQERPILAAISTLGIILTAVYILRAVMKMTFGQATFSEIHDLRVVEWLPSAVLLGCILWIGIYPAVLGNALHTAIDSVLVAIGG
jgi:NADH-quinone oxidoreductase subunit M